MGNVTHAILDTRPSRFSGATFKGWEQPGNEANYVKYSPDMPIRGRYYWR